MNAELNAFFTMGDAVRVVCNEYAAVLASKPSFKTIFNRFMTDVMDVYPQALARQGQDTTGITADKNAARAVLEAQMLSLGRKIEAYAASVANLSLRKSAHTTQSGLHAFSDRALIGEADRLGALAVAHKSHLGPFGVDENVLAALTDATADYTGWLGRPQAAIDARQGGTLELDALAQKGRSMLDQMDAQMILFEEDAPGFYQQYFLSRQLTQPPTRHRAITFRVTDEKGQPVPDAMVSVPALGLEKRTGPKGECYVATAPAGTYAARIQKNGYQSVDVSIAINTGEGTLVKAELAIAS